MIKQYEITELNYYIIYIGLLYGHWLTIALHLQWFHLFTDNKCTYYWYNILFNFERFLYFLLQMP